MRTIELPYKIIVSFVLLFICFGLTTTILGQSESLGAVKYTPPKGWAKSAKEHAVVFSEVNSKTGNFCFITLYAAAPSAGTPQQDFAREWKNRVVEPWAGEASPKTVTEPDKGWTAVAAGSPIDFQGNKAFAFLTVISGFGKAVSVLGILNDESYVPKLQAFVEGMDVDKSVAETPVIQSKEPSPTPAVTAAAMHVSSLVKEFETNEVRANQVWIGKRVRVYGTVNSIEIAKNGNIEMTFKSSISTYKMGRAFFNQSQSSRVSSLNAHEQATIECTVKGLGGGFDNSKAYLLLESCTVP